jgi:hypothetical protein
MAMSEDKSTMVIRHSPPPKNKKSACSTKMDLKTQESVNVKRCPHTSTMTVYITEHPVRYKNQ